ncbi:MAG: glycosyltransferase family 2 protein [Proteobacteria bacterium]|nr:glycosyltransferase family 2 protein [Pseudomonadota bacterium]
MIGRKRLTALIPAHNDDYALNLCLESIVDHFDEIFVLDDCSSDSTPDLLSDFSARYKHLSFVRVADNQLGWVDSRNRLASLTDSDWLFFIDSDDVLVEYNGHLLEKIAEGKRPHVKLQLTEMWGDFNHGTGRIRHYDPCHVFLNRSILRNFSWRGSQSAMLKTGSFRAVVGSGPLFFHIKGIKPDRRIVERTFVKKWLKDGRKSALHDFYSFSKLNKYEIHRLAVKRLLTSKIDKIRRYRGPRLPEVLRSSNRRFEMVYRDRRIVDRVDHFS